MGRIEDAHVTYRNALERGEFKPDVVKFLRQKAGNAESLTMTRLHGSLRYLVVIKQRNLHVTEEFW